ncbi:MAG: hypothetical protein AAGE88_14970 [Actinomycetota bacterium]
MTVVALTSTRSSPGVTSLAVALGLVWQRQGREPLLVEADPAGGVLGLRFDLAAEPSLASLAADLRRGYESERFTKNGVDVLGVRSLLAPVDPLTASRVLHRNGEALSAAVRAAGRPTVIDLGRLDGYSPALALAAGADRVLVVGRPRVEDVQSLLFGCRLLRGHRIESSLVAVGARPYAPHEVAAHAGLPLAAVIPDDPELAAAFSGGRFSGRRLRRSLLWRSIQALADALLANALPPDHRFAADLAPSTRSTPSTASFIGGPEVATAHPTGGAEETTARPTGGLSTPSAASASSAQALPSPPTEPAPSAQALPSPPTGPVASARAPTSASDPRPSLDASVRRGSHRASAVEPLALTELIGWQARPRGAAS